MVAVEDLRQYGWHVSSEGFEHLLSQFDDEEDPTPSELHQLALDCDLKTFGAGFLSEKGAEGIVQVQKVKNVAAPSIAQGQTPRMILVSITDGKSNAQMLEFERQNRITVDTLPGTKLRLKQSKTIESYISLTNGAIEVLGGEVDKMIEKWLVERDSTQSGFRVRSFEQGGPPPFIPFEKRHKRGGGDNDEDLSQRKTLATIQGDNENDNEDVDAEFEAERKEALQQIEAVRLKFAKVDLSNIKRNFFDAPTAGGRSGHQYRQNRRNEEKEEEPVKKPVAVQKPKTVYNALPTVSGLKLDQKLLGTLIEMGFDRGLATQALQEADNDFHMALDGLENLKEDNRPVERNMRETRRGGRGKRGRNRRNHAEEEERAPQSSSLFDFMAADLPPTKTMTVQVGQTMANTDFKRTDQYVAEVDQSRNSNQRNRNNQDNYGDNRRDNRDNGRNNHNSRDNRGSGRGGTRNNDKGNRNYNSREDNREDSRNYSRNNHDDRGSSRGGSRGGTRSSDKGNRNYENRNDNRDDHREDNRSYGRNYHDDRASSRGGGRGGHRGDHRGDHRGGGGDRNNRNYGDSGRNNQNRNEHDDRAPSRGSSGRGGSRGGGGGGNHRGGARGGSRGSRGGSRGGRGGRGRGGH